MVISPLRLPAASNSGNPPPLLPRCFFISLFPPAAPPSNPYSVQRTLRLVILRVSLHFVWVAPAHHPAGVLPVDRISSTYRPRSCPALFQALKPQRNSFSAGQTSTDSCSLSPAEHHSRLRLCRFGVRPWLAKAAADVRSKYTRSMSSQSV